MDTLAIISKYGIYAIFGVTLLAALLAVAVRNIFHAALALVLTLLGVAATYFILRAEFLGAIQILLYVGAIVTLIIFAVMLTYRMSDTSIPTSNRQRLPVGVGIVILIAFLARVMCQTSWPTKTVLTTIDAGAIGKALMSNYVFPFEVISLVLVVALVGAIVVARGDE